MILVHNSSHFSPFSMSAAEITEQTSRYWQEPVNKVTIEEINQYIIGCQTKYRLCHQLKEQLNFRRESLQPMMDTFPIIIF